ncbi:MAG: DUF3467 domain-containing protein [Deltaproteobacteria bacterium]|nr:DUF3467 domain-containing protein [Deltaproteobacteria bacterium]
MSDEHKTPPHPLQVKIELDPATAQGLYVNMALVNHSETEFTLDFIYVQPQEPKGKVRARVISSPKHTKRLLLALKDAVEGYEKKYGSIETSTTPAPAGDFLN